jgi:hypothetical protein
MDQPGWSGPEAAGIKVERRQVLFKVHVQPRATISVSVSGPRQRYSITWDTCWIVQYAPGGSTTTPRSPYVAMPDVD